MRSFLGIDWGGTNIEIGVVDEKGFVLKKKIFPSQKLTEPKLFLAAIEQSISSFKTKITAVGIGAPGIINIKKGFIYYLPNIKGWVNYPLKKILEKKVKLPVFIDNDANVFALAELRKGNAKGTKRSLVFTLGTGLGAGIILGGKVFRGEVSAAELGHMPLSLGGRKCSCGATGCIETYTSSFYLAKKYRRLKRIKVRVSVKEIYQRALAGEKEALKIWEGFSLALGKFLGGLINVFNPQKIILGGRVAGAWRIFFPLLKKEVQKQAMWPQYSQVKIMRAKLKANAGVIGAGFLAKDLLKH